MTAANPSHSVTDAQGLTSSALEPATSALTELVIDPSFTSSNTDSLQLPTVESKTIYYLAYGSNLSSSVFQGRRGVRPLSSTPVHVPSLNLCFNLAGIAYLEPCMANVCLRDEIALEIPTPNTTVSSTISTFETAPLLQASTSAAAYSAQDGPSWTQGLVGVVYEVTPEDYAKIWATEGGGSSYQDVVVPCYPLPPNSVSPTADPNTAPIKAHTLFASDPKMLRPTDPQPSRRYLNLLRTGAREHELPKPYVGYLDALQHYEPTTVRQKVGRMVWAAMWVPMVLTVFGLANLFKEKDGSSPGWMRTCQEMVFGVMWKCYDNGFKRVFGDGERTVRDGKERVYGTEKTVG